MHSAHTSVVRHGLRVLAAGMCLTAAVAIWALIAGRFDDTSGRVLLTGLAAALCTLGGLAGSTALPLEDRGRRAGKLTIGLSQLVLLLTLALIWIPGAANDDTLRQSLGISGVLMLAGAHASLLLSWLSELDTRTVDRLRYGAIVCGSSAALLLSGVIAASDGPVASGIWRLLGVLVVLAVLNTLLIPLARRITRDAKSRGGRRTGSSARLCL
jgi:MFS family permease